MALFGLGPFSELNVTQFTYMVAMAIYVAVMLYTLAWSSTHLRGPSARLAKEHPVTVRTIQCMDMLTILLAIWVFVQEFGSLYVPGYDLSLQQWSETVAWAIPLIVVWWPIKWIWVLRNLGTFFEATAQEYVEHDGVALALKANGVPMAQINAVLEGPE